MIENKLLTELMELSIEESKKSMPEDMGIHPKVGAVLIDEYGNILQKSHRGEYGKGDHAEFICIEKAIHNGNNLDKAILFATLEPCTARGPGKKPCVERIIESGINKVYIGMLDPNPQICGRGETRLRFYLDVERYPGYLIKKLEDINKDFIEINKKYHLSTDSLYIQKQINDLIWEYLVRKGIPLLDQLPVGIESTTNDLISICEAVSEKNPDTITNIHSAVIEARSEAFDNKYSDRTYKDDTRGLGDHWKDAIRNILSKMGAYDYHLRRLIVVGISNGLEGEELYANCKHLIAVDIGKKSLEKAKLILPNAEFINAEAEDLSMIPTRSQDIYISLRTFQSSYFDRDAAIREAYRIVRQGGIVLISVANGFLDKDAIINGLLVPGTTIVDSDLGFQIADQIRRKMTNLRFESIGINTTFDEVFIYGRRGR